jgi:membrane protein required for colicin V production
MIDILFAVVLLLAVIKGFRKGLIIAIFSIIAFIIGLAAALKLSVAVATYFEHSLSITGKWVPFIAYAVVFMAVVWLVNLGAKLIEKSVEMVLLGWLNRLGGILFFVLLYTIIFSIFLFYTEKIHLFNGASLAASKVYPYVKPWGPKVMDALGQVVPVFKNMFAQLEAFFQGLGTEIPH